jgi:hypothetical protein
MQIVLGGQQCQISVYLKGGYAYSDTPGFTSPNTNLYFDLMSNGVPITTTAICLNDVRLLKNRQYLSFVGDFMFVDTEGTSDPNVTGLGTRFLLLYLTPTDITGAEDAS